VAEETDAARRRVLVARTDLAAELDRMEASARAAVDIPAKVKRSPAKAAAIAGGTGFLVLGGPKRLFKRVKRVVVGPEPPRPKRMLPNEIEKTLEKMGEDGDRIRGTLERDFRDYVEEAQKKRGPATTAVVGAALMKPLVGRAVKSAAEWFARPDDQGFAAQLERVRARMATGGRTATGDGASTGERITVRPDTGPDDR